MSSLRLLPLALLAIGCESRPSPTTASSAGAPRGALAIASSDLGFRVDLDTGRKTLYEPRYEQTGEEKLLPPRVLDPKSDAKIVGFTRTAREITLSYADGSRETIKFAANGRQIVERFTPAPPPGAKPGSYTQQDGFRTSGPTRPLTSPAIPIPRVSITIDSDDPRDNRVVKALLDDLITAVHPRLRRSIAPMGLTNEIYFGHVFWDADVWIFPALALLDPEAAAEIPKYRLRTLAQARENGEAWVRAGRPTASGKLGSIPPDRLPVPGAKFAWESSESGRETVPGPSRFEDHISGSVAWSVGQAAALGLVEAEPARALRRDVAAFYTERAETTARGREIRDVVSPDEHHTGDNDLYTNLLAQNLTGERFYLPRDARNFLSYDGDKGRGYKQAAALLAVYPLQYGPAEREAAVMLDRFAPGVIANGPAMTDAIHAIVAARIGRADEALGYWHRSWEGFYDLDRGMFSERRKGTRREYFYTGAAGTLQAVLYGFVGLRIGTPAPGGTLVAKLRDGQTLTCAPHLPKGWRSVRIDGLTVLGTRRSLAIYADGRVELRPAASR